MARIESIAAERVRDAQIEGGGKIWRRGGGGGVIVKLGEAGGGNVNRIFKKERQTEPCLFSLQTHRSL